MNGLLRKGLSNHERGLQHSLEREVGGIFPVLLFFIEKLYRNVFCMSFRLGRGERHDEFR